VRSFLLAKLLQNALSPFILPLVFSFLPLRGLFVEGAGWFLKNAKQVQPRPKAHLWNMAGRNAFLHFSVPVFFSQGWCENRILGVNRPCLGVFSPSHGLFTPSNLFRAVLWLCGEEVGKSGG